MAKVPPAVNKEPSVALLRLRLRLSWLRTSAQSTFRGRRVNLNAAIEMYEEVLGMCDGNVALEELIREMIRLETEHIEEVVKMLNVST